MVNFMLDPKGEMPWEEDPEAQHVAHLANQKVRHRSFLITLDRLIDLRN